MSYEAMMNYHVSVIEREVTAGILRASNTKSTCLAFLRKIKNLNMTDTKAGNNSIHQR